MTVLVFKTLLSEIISHTPQRRQDMKLLYHILEKKQYNKKNIVLIKDHIFIIKTL